MADQEQVEILKQGVDAWNQWRANNPDETVDLTGVDLTRYDLTGINFHKADLSNAILKEVSLTSADLSEAKLVKADFSIPAYSFFSEAPGRNANLSYANCYNTDFSEANLSDVYLTRADLRYASFREANLSRSQLNWAILSYANFSKANLSQANLIEATTLDTESMGRANAGENTSSQDDTVLDTVYFDGANLEEANFERANLSGAYFREAILTKALLSGANLFKADLIKADLKKANFMPSERLANDIITTNLRQAKLIRANLQEAYLNDTDLCEADLCEADLRDTSLIRVDLSRSNLTNTQFVRADVSGATISGSRVYAINVWDLVGEFKEQKNLNISPEGAAAITVDDVEVAQFIYLILNNQKLRDVLDTVTSKSVLILGRFNLPERKAVLDALRNKLREKDLLPIVFDFNRPVDKDLTETIKTLAGLSYFVIADITSPKSTPLELQATVPDFQIPFMPIIQYQEGDKPFAMMRDLQTKYDWVYGVLEYESLDQLIQVIEPAIIDPAIELHNTLRLRKANKPTVRYARDFLKESDESS